MAKTSPNSSSFRASPNTGGRIGASVLPAWLTEALEAERTAADMLRTYGAAAAADAVERAVDRIADHVYQALTAELTYTEASAECGISADALRMKVKRGEIRNVGRAGSPRVLRGDVLRIHNNGGG